MEQLNYYFPDHWGRTAQNADVVLYEIPWNNYGYRGFFEFQFFRKKTKYNIKKTLSLSICRIDGTMKKRHELREIYSPSDKCFTRLSDQVYISFPSTDLCLGLLLNFTLEQRKEIAINLCFNFGKGPEFEKFKDTEQYSVSILRACSEDDFLGRLKECEKILFCDLEINELLDREDIIRTV